MSLLLLAAASVPGNYWASDDAAATAGTQRYRPKTCTQLSPVVCVSVLVDASVDYLLRQCHWRQLRDRIIQIKEEEEKEKKEEKARK